MSAKLLAVVALGVGYAATWIFGVPAVRTEFKRPYVEYIVDRVLADASPDMAERWERDREKIIESASLQVDHVVPILPGIMLVSHSVTAQPCAPDGTTLVLWFPAYLGILTDVH